MKKRAILLASLLVLTAVLCACSGTSDTASLQTEVTDLKAQVAELQSNYDSVVAERDSLKKTVDELQSRLDEKKAETTVAAGDVTVTLTGKSTSEGQYGEKYADFVFSVTNNTGKAIKGIQGVSTFKDLFGVDILKLNCDFTGTTIDAGATVQIDTLSLDCNPFMDDDMKLYGTAYDDLNMAYAVTSIVFTDGTTKK